MEVNPIKVIQVSGIIENKLTQSQFNLSLEISAELQRDYANFNEGVWELCVKDVCTETLNITKTLLFEVSTNFVNGQFTQTERRQPIPLERFMLRKITNELIYFNKFEPQNWYTINSPSAEFRIFIKCPEFFTNFFPNYAKLKFLFTILFRRVK